MKIWVLGCAVAGLIVLTPTSEAVTTALLKPLPVARRTPLRPPCPVKMAPIAEIGLASWYGAERQGLPTASGESFDQDGFTAAHLKLPFGTIVRVTNLKNRIAALLRINDRGPGSKSRVIDISWAAALKLGFADAGVARVQVEVVSYPGNRSHTPTPPNSVPTSLAAVIKPN